MDKAVLDNKSIPGQEIHIVAATDSGYEQHTAVMLASLFHNNKAQSFCIHLLHSNKAKEINKLKKFVEKKEGVFNSYAIREESLKGFKITHHVSLATYFRLLMPDLLPENIHKIIYLDSDLVVLSPINEMWNTELGDCLAAAVKTPFDRYEELEIDRRYAYFNAGVMLLDLEKLRQLNFTQNAVNYLQRKIDHILFWDQDVINYIIQGRIKPLDKFWNMMPEDEENDKKKSRIFHYAGSIKPWTFPQDNNYDKLYFRYLMRTPWFYKCFENRHFLKLSIKSYVR